MFSMWIEQFITMNIQVFRLNTLLSVYILNPFISNGNKTTKKVKETKTTKKKTVAKKATPSKTKVNKSVKKTD